jgi:hypothetical protein
VSVSHLDEHIFQPSLQFARGQRAVSEEMLAAINSTRDRRPSKHFRISGSDLSTGRQASCQPCSRSSAISRAKRTSVCSTRCQSVWRCCCTTR